MPEYIEREAAKDELLSWAVCINHPEHLMREDAMHVLDGIPASDVAPVRHGRWIWHSEERGYLCSECGSGCLLNYESDWHKSDWCPHCGAKMDGGEPDA